MSEQKNGKKSGGRPKTAPRDPNAPKETKSERFRRLAKARVPRALKAINGVANLTGSGYEYTPEQADKVVAALTAAVDSLRKRYAGASVQAETFDV